MDDVGLDPMPGRPSCQPEPVTPGFEANTDACAGATAPRCLITPSLQHAQQVRFVRRDLLQWLALDPRDGPGNQPARLTELDDSNQSGGLVRRETGNDQRR